MKYAILSVTFRLVIVAAFVCMRIHAVDARSPETITQSVRVTRCFQDTELTLSLATLKLQGGAEVAKISESLIAKTKTSSRCRTEVIQALVRALEQATDLKANQYENFFLWLHGASLLADLKATEALDLLIANIDLTDGWSAKLSQSHTPVLAAILKIGTPAIPKLQILLKNDPVPYRRKFAAFAIAYIGGGQARRALEHALPNETDPCVKKFLQLSLQAFDNRTKPNHITSELNGKWLSAFYCL